MPSRLGQIRVSGSLSLGRPRASPVAPPEAEGAFGEAMELEREALTVVGAAMRT